MSSSTVIGVILQEIFYAQETETAIATDSMVQWSQNDQSTNSYNGAFSAAPMMGCEVPTSDESER
jgi:hypothetical protein